MHVGHARIKRGSNFDNVFYYFFCFLVWGKEGTKIHYKWAIKGPPAKRHLNGISLAGRWCSNIEFCDFKGIRPSIAKEPYVFVIFQGGGGGGGGSGRHAPFGPTHVGHIRY